MRFSFNTPFLCDQNGILLLEDFRSVVLNLDQVLKGAVDRAYLVGELAGLFPDDFSVVSGRFSLSDLHVLDDEGA